MWKAFFIIQLLGCTFILTAQNDTSWVREQYEIGKSFYPRDIDSLKWHYNQGLKVAEEIDDFRGQVIILRSKGGVNLLNGQYESAVEDIQRAIGIIKEHNLSSEELMNGYINLGAAYSRGGKAIMSLSAYLKADSIAVVIHDDAKRSMILNNLGIHFRTAKRYDDALDIYNQATEIRRRLKDTLGLGHVKLNMAICYSFMGDALKQVEASEEALELYSAVGSVDDILLAKASFADGLIRLKEYERGLEQFEGVKLSDLEVNVRLAGTISKARALFETNNVEGSLKLLKDVEAELNQSDLLIYQREYYELRARIHSKLGKWKIAYEDFERYEKYAQESAAFDNLKYRKEMEEKFLTVEKDYQIEKQALLLETERKNRFWLILGLLSALFAACLLGWIAVSRKKTAVLLKSKNEVIALALKEKDNLLKEIHHRVKNNLQIVSSLLSLQSNSTLSKDAKAAIDDGRNRVQSMALIHQNLFIDKEIAHVNTKDYIPKLANHIYNSYAPIAKGIDMQVDVDSIEMDVDTVVPIGLIINELITNAMKYAFVDRDRGILIVRLSERANAYEIEVADNGIGMEKSQKISNRVGIGSQLIRSFCEKLEADYNIDNVNGTKINIVIPKSQTS